MKRSIKDCLYLLFYASIATITIGVGIVLLKILESFAKFVFSL